MRKRHTTSQSKEKGKRKSSSEKSIFDESITSRRPKAKEKKEVSNQNFAQSEIYDKSKNGKEKDKGFSKKSYGYVKRKFGENEPHRKNKTEAIQNSGKYYSDREHPYDKSNLSSNKKSNHEFSKKSFCKDRTKTSLFEKKDIEQVREKFRKTPGGYREYKKRTLGLMRLNKYISNAGYCSRREADTLIVSGAVRVNGQIITELGFKIEPNSIVSVDNQTIRQEKFQYILLNKPKDVITTCNDPQGRITVLNLIKGACKERVYPVGRLDRNTTGLLLLTNDGDFAKKIAHPSSRVKKLYEVSLDKKLKHEDFEEISKGVWIEENTFVDVDDLDYVDGANAGNVVGIEIHSGKYHVVKRIFEKYGYIVTKLDRTKIDILTKKNLQRGKWRFLTESEINLLKRH